MKKLFVIIFAVLSFSVCSINVFGHSAILDIEYDECSCSQTDDYSKKWYEISGDLCGTHLPHTITEIKYYISETNEDGTLNWNSTGKTDDEAEEMLAAYINGMKKWNNAYFYYQNSDGTIVKKKIVNITEGTSSDYNLIIYPAIYQPTGDTITYATTSAVNDSMVNMTQKDDVFQIHYGVWINKINLLVSSTDLIMRSGAHEIGHVLGLDDIERTENGNNTSGWHHNELLMGYFQGGSTEITYRDLAGVAITREFHTDNDHKWLYDSSSSESGNYKLICSICNGVKYVSNLSSYTYDIYKSCNSNHSLTSNNMMAVGCYQNKDYYKCKYCRYVAPFTSNVTQNYQFYESVTTTIHKVINNVTGLEYITTEEYTYTWLNNTQHRRKCDCSGTVTEGHAISEDAFNNGSQTATCLLCGGVATIGFIQNSNIIKVSDNGSYILSNGIVVLKEVDISPYLNHTLVFRDIDEEIM